jgi:hypothetical protein
MHAMTACPICKGSALPRTDNADHPFCGSRCKLIDLGKWLGEAYRVPTQDSADSDEHSEAAS